MHYLKDFELGSLFGLRNSHENLEVCYIKPFDREDITDYLKKWVSSRKADGLRVEDN